MESHVILLPHFSLFRKKVQKLINERCKDNLNNQMNEPVYRECIDRISIVLESIPKIPITIEKV